MNHYKSLEIVRDVFSRTFLVHVWRKCRSADCFCRKMIYSTSRVDLFCALCTSWSVAKYCRFCWKLILFDTRSATLHYCTKAESGTVCHVCRFVQGALSFEALSGKNTAEFYWRRGFSLFSSGLNEDGGSPTTVNSNHDKACRNDAVANSATTGRNVTTTRRNAGSRTAVPRPS